MIVSDSHRLLFVHVQKTGGSSIDQVLRPVLGEVRSVTTRHAPLERILQAEPGLAAYWTFGFVRNPWARLHSWWRMTRRFGDGASGGIERYVRHLERNAFLRDLTTRFPDFESFVLGATAEYGRLRMPQVDYLTSRTRRADFIGRQETLEADLRAVFARLDLPWTPPGDQNRDHRPSPYRDAYTPAMRDRVAELFAADLAAFDYSF